MSEINRALLVFIVACCAPLVCFAFKAWTDYQRRDWWREDRELHGEALRAFTTATKKEGDR